MDDQTRSGSGTDELIRWTFGLITKYNDDQPRDDHGMWTSGGSSSVTHEETTNAMGMRSEHWSSDQKAMSRLAKAKSSVFGRASAEDVQAKYNMSQEQRVAVARWTGRTTKEDPAPIKNGDDRRSYFAKMADDMRNGGGDKDTQAQNKALASVFNKDALTVDRDVSVNRGFVMSKADADQMFKAYTGGSSVTLSDKSFVATSTKPGVATVFARTAPEGSVGVRINVLVPKGTRALAIGEAGMGLTFGGKKEGEVLLSPSTNIRLIGVSQGSAMGGRIYFGVAETKK